MDAGAFSTIDKGIPLPPRGRARVEHPLMLEMAVGDSYLFPPKPNEKAYDTGARAGNVMRRYAKHHRMKFARRTLLEGGVKVVRIWRTA